MIDLPYHGETIGTYNDDQEIQCFVDKLKLV